MRKLILLFTIIIFCLNDANAQPGTLDASFGKNGIVSTDLGSVYNYSTIGKKVLLQPDGSFFAVNNHPFGAQSLISKKKANGSVDSTYGHDGFSNSIPIAPVDAAIQSDGKIVILDQNFVIARCNSNGLLDSSFGLYGVTSATKFGKSSISNSITIQKDGRLVIAGYVRNNGNTYFAVSRYNISGALDSTFSDDGKVITDFGFSIPSEDNDYPEMDLAKSVAIQSDGKIIVAGSAFNYSNNFNEFAIARYSQAGTLDSTFDNDGIQTTSFDSNAEGYSLGLQKDGKILVAGYAGLNDSYNSFAITRYTIDGNLDSTFNGIGKQTTFVGTTDFLFNSIAIQKDEKIVVAGSAYNANNNDFVIIRYKLDGSLDNTFDKDGSLLTDFGSDDYVTSIAIQSDGKIVAIGYSTTTILSRYNTNGSLDNAFDGDGKLIEDLHQGSTMYSGSVIQKDGKLVVAGYTWNGYDYDFVIARYNTSGSLDNTFNGKGSQITDFGQTEYQPHVAVQNDGRIIIAGTTGYNNTSFAIARYNINGTIDSTFSGDGKQSSYLGYSASAFAIAIQTDGKIVVAGDFILVRYNTDGSFDKTFNNSGIINPNFFIYSLAIQRDGKLVIGGHSNGDVEIMRVNTDGTIDNTFDMDGIQTTDYGFDDETVCSIILQNDGKIIAAAQRRGSVNQFLLSRYNTNGTLDTTFSSDGKQTTVLGNTNAFATSIAIESNGKIIVAGNTTTERDNFAFVRYNSDGSLDNTFGKNGIQISDASGSYDRLENISLIKDKLYAVGSAQFPGTLGEVARYLLTANTTPTATITSPGNNATYTAPATITINAAATDSDGTISAVRFYKNGTLVSTDSISPYTYTLTNAAAGNYSFIAKATDNNGLSGLSASVAVSVSAQPNKAPVVNITSPANNTVYTAPATITVTATASDADGTVSNVKFYNGSTLIRTDSTSPYSCTLTNLAGGNYTITAKAADNKGLSAISASVAIAVSVTANKAPVVSITSPAHNAVYTAGTTINLAASASDADGTVSNVKFYKGSTLLRTDSTSPYTYTLTNAAAGNYSITTKATDNKGLSGSSASVAITVSGAANKAPTVSITNPANNANYTSPASITINAAAADADGTVSNVKFYNGSTLLSTDSVSPYTYTLTNAAAGNYSITAKATDNNGLSNSSASITVSVAAGTSNKAPTVSITSPANNTVYSTPATITINALAADADGTISNVKFYNGTGYLRTVFASPYTYTLSNLAAGTYSLTVKATDNTGAETISAPVTVSVKAPNKAPTVSITSPANNATFPSPATIKINALAADADGTVSNVKFYNGTIYLKTVFASPYTYTLSNLAAGTYSVTAKATDNNGDQTISAAIKVTVKESAAIVTSKPNTVTNLSETKTAISLKAWPNPASKTLTISTTGLQQNKSTTISILSATGVIMKTIRVNNSTTQLDVSSLTSGVYTIKFLSGDKVLYRQFVKL